MTHPRTALLAVIGLASAASPSVAGWNNVFLTGCWDCRPRVAQRPPAPAPRAETHTEWERTSYSVPVTVMRPERYTEEVPVQVRSHYYEPVTSYRTSYSLDECGRCQQVQVPCRTTQVRREYTETVMKAVERVRMVPVQMERIVTEERPKYTTTHYGPVRRTTSGLQPVESGPSIGVEREGGAPGTIPPANVPMRMNPPGANDVSAPRRPVPVPPPAPVPTNFRPNAMTTSLKPALGGGTLTGEVVQNDKETPLANAKLVFVNAKELDAREYVTADGYFASDLPVACGGDPADFDGALGLIRRIVLGRDAE